MTEERYAHGTIGNLSDMHINMRIKGFREKYVWKNRHDCWDVLSLNLVISNPIKYEMHIFSVVPLFCFGFLGAVMLRVCHSDRMVFMLALNKIWLKIL